MQRSHERARRLSILLLALPVLAAGAAACVSNRVLDDGDPPASLARELDERPVEPLGFAADLQVSAPPSGSASNIGVGGLSSQVYRYPLRPLIEEVFSRYFVPSLFELRFEGDVASAFRVEVGLESAHVDLGAGRATANVEIDVRILGAEYKEELFRDEFRGSGSSDFGGSETPAAIWEAVHDAAREALFAAHQDPRLATYRSERPLYAFENDGPRWVVGVFPFQVAERKAGLDDSTSAVITGKLMRDLLERSDRIAILEQEKLETLMQEKQYQQGGFTQEVVARMGQELGARFMIFGTVAYHANQYTVTFRMVDVETRQIIANPIEISPKASSRELERVTRRAVNQLLRRLDEIAGRS